MLRRTLFSFSPPLFYRRFGGVGFSIGYKQVLPLDPPLSWGALSRSHRPSVPSSTFFPSEEPPLAARWERGEIETGCRAVGSPPPSDFAFFLQS